MHVFFTAFAQCAWLALQTCPFPHGTKQQNKKRRRQKCLPTHGVSLGLEPSSRKGTLKKGLLLGGQTPRFYFIFAGGTLDFRGAVFRPVFGPLSFVFGSFSARKPVFGPKLAMDKTRKHPEPGVQQPEPCVQQPEPSVQTTVSELMGFRLLLDGSIGATTPFYQQKPPL